MKKLCLVIGILGLSIFTNGQSCAKLVNDYVLFINKTTSYLKSVMKDNSKYDSKKMNDINLQRIKWQEKVAPCMSNEKYLVKIMAAAEKMSQAVNGGSSQSSDNPGSSSRTRSNNANQICTYCKPNDSKGWHITDYDPTNKIWPNPRYIKRPGYIPCETCHGTGNCKAYSSCSTRQEFDGNYTCQRCNGDRFQICKHCDGTGYTRN